MYCPYVYLHTKLMTDAQEVAMAGSFERKTLCDFIGMVCIFFLDGTLSLCACALYAGSCCSEILKSSGSAERPVKTSGFSIFFCPRLLC